MAAAVATPIPPEEIRAESYVGFDTITQQIEHKLLKRGFQFNVILVGRCLFCSFSFPHSLSFFQWEEVEKCNRVLMFNAFTGQTGLGKSTLINTIFASHLVDSKGRFVADEPVRQTTEIQAVSHGRITFFLDSRKRR
jgi:septin 3/9/12